MEVRPISYFHSSIWAIGVDFSILYEERPPIGSRWPGEVSELIQSSWSQDPKARPSFDDIAAELLFFDIDDDNL